MATFQSLPIDVMRLICSQLYAESRESMCSLWQVSRAWRSISEEFVYRGFALAVRSHEFLEEDVKTLTEHEYASKYLKHARCIYITKETYGWAEDEDQKESSGLAPLPSSFDLDGSAHLFDNVFTADEPELHSEAQERWKSFVALLPKFQNITDLVLEIRSKLPPGLLEVLENHYPTCKLHLWNFRFKSLNDDATDPDERALATSPNLYSLSVKHMYRDSNGMDDHNAVATLETVKSAPNLKHIRMLGCRPASSPGLYQARGRPLTPWKGFMPPIEDSRAKKNMKTRLESFRLEGYNDRLTISKLQKWEEVADLSCVEALSCSIHSSDILDHVAVLNKFPSVVELHLGLKPSQYDDRSGWEPALENFFSSLCPLEALFVSGSMHSAMLNLIAKRHGKTLKALSICPFADGYDMPGPPLRLTANAIEILARECPNLAGLRLILPRSMGDRTETRCYEALGMLRNLKRLRLKLDCSNEDPWQLKPEAEWDDFDKAAQTMPGSNPKHYNGHLKRAMINSALDETLARQIWSVIDSGSQGLEPKQSLQLLIVSTYGGSAFGNSYPVDLVDICNNLSRTYSLSRTPGTHNVEVVELSKGDREEEDENRRKDEQAMVEKWGHNGRTGPSWNVFRHVWPCEEDADWTVVWKSRPLQLGDS